MIWEVAGLKEKRSGLLAASLKAVSGHSNATYRSGPLYSKPKLPLSGRGVRRIGKIAKSDHLLNHVRPSVVRLLEKKNSSHLTVFPSYVIFVVPPPPGKFKFH